MTDATWPANWCPSDVLNAIANLGSVLGTQHMTAAAQQAAATQTLADQLCGVGKHIGDSTGRLSQQMGDESLGITKHVGDTTHRIAQSLGDFAQRLSVQIGESTLGVTNRVDAQGSSIRDAIGDTRREVAAEACDVSKVVSTEAREMTGFNAGNFNFIRKDLCDGFTNATRDVERNTRELVQNMDRNFQAVALKACMDTENIRRDVAVTGKEILLKQAEDTNLLVRVIDKETAALHLGQKDLLHRTYQSEAAVLAAVAASKYELSKQIAECCCEQKELTRDQAGQTRDLINSVESRRQADELAECRSELRHLRTQVNVGIGVGVAGGIGVGNAGVRA